MMGAAVRITRIGFRMEFLPCVTLYRMKEQKCLSLRWLIFELCFCFPDNATQIRNTYEPEPNQKEGAGR